MTVVATCMLLMIAAPAAAQDNIQSPPVLTAPRLETFTPPQATPTPAPTPVPTPSPAAPPPPVVRTATPTPTPTATLSPRPARTATPTPLPSPAATPRADAATPAPLPSAVPLATATPTPPAASTPATIATADAPSSTSVLIAVGALLLLAAAVGVTLWRRARRSAATPAVEEPVLAPAIPVPSPARPTALPPPPPADVATPPGRSVVATVRPKEMWTHGPDAFLTFELVVTNHGAEPADGIRVAMALTSAGPGIADEVARWQAGAEFPGTAEPFSLRQGESYVLGGDLKLPGDLMYVNEVGDRAMIVPVAMVALRWRGGLAVRSAGDAFVVGTGDATAAKLGPIWVDRAGQRFTTLDARRFQPRE